MTDNEIIKALKCCNKPIRENSCTECAFYHSGKCSSNMLNAALDLINRQKAENDSLKVGLAKCSIRLDNLYKTADEIKSEAIKEFAERLKETCYTYSDICGYQSTVVDVNHIDNLVKEMTEVETNQRKEDEGK